MPLTESYIRHDNYGLQEARMIDLQAGLLPDGGTTVTVAGLVGGLGLGGFLRGYLRYRTRIQVERELSARTRARTRGLIRLVGGRHEDLRIDERDHDGHRVVELRGPRRADDGEAA
jgi:hypothetical protein